MVARRAHNPKVVGSNPAPATRHKYNLRIENNGLSVAPLAHFFCL